MESYIDLHIHSNNSDGDLSVQEIIERAKKLNLSTISITDHDDIRSIDEVKKNNIGNIEYVFGIELSSKIDIFGKERNIDILGYGINDMDEQLNNILENKKKIRYNSNKMYLINMLKEFPFLKDDILEEIDCSRYIRFSRLIYNYLDKKNFSYDELKLITNYLKYNHNIYDNYNLDVKDTIKTIINAGGYPVIAHPYQYRLNYDQIKEMIQYMKSFGLIGIETIHSGDSYDGMNAINNICKELDMEYTIGSDFHTDIDDNGREIGYGINNNLCINNCSLLKKLRMNNKIYRR